MGLAAVAVGLYMADLAGWWAALGVAPLVGGVALVIDLVFVLDLALKLVAGRARYLRSPWFVVDLLCALPVLSSFSAAPTLLQGLRLVRMMRVLRALRMIRSLRTLRVLRIMDDATESKEARAFDRTLRLGVIGYALVFTGLIYSIRSKAEDLGVSEMAGRVELWFVLGSILGMALILLLSHYLVPAVFSKQVRALLNVALPPQVADWFMAHPEAYEQTVRMPATVVFCDIKGFTATSEGLPLDALKQHLERAMDVVVEAHLAQDLIIDKFIGDAVMSFRGGNMVSGTPEEHAYRVVRGALDGALALARSGEPMFREVKLGCASSTHALIGTFGTSRRLSYTILGDRVNLASRLEGACAALGVRGLFCDLTQSLVGERPGLVWRRVGILTVSGKAEEVGAWEVFDASEVLDWLPTFHEGLQAWTEGRPKDARHLFQETNTRRAGGDALSRVYLAHLEGVADDDTTYSRVIETRK